MKQKILITLVAILTLGLLASCASQSDALVVATDPAFPPLK